MYVAGQPGVVTNGMMGMPPQMIPSMQVCMYCTDGKYKRFKDAFIPYLHKKVSDLYSAKVSEENQGATSASLSGVIPHQVA